MFLVLQKLGSHRIRKTDFARLGWSFRYLISETKSVTPQFFHISDTSNPFPSCSKSFMEKSINVRRFCVSVLKLSTETFSEHKNGQILYLKSLSFLFMPNS